MKQSLLLLTVASLSFVSVTISRDERTLRKKRCVGVFCNQGFNPFVGSFNGFGPFGPFILNNGQGGGTLEGIDNGIPPQTQQTCVGSQCQQNNGNVQSFGGHAGIGGSVTQNCVGSQCQQNNGGHLSGETSQNCFGSQCQPPNNGNGQGQGFEGHSVGGGFAAQSCIGSQCQQNNAQGLGGHVAGSQAQNCVGSECQQNNANSRDVGIHVQDAPGLGGSAQNCVGSKCQQNNLGGALFGNFGSNFQTCIGSECQQNNERRKREVATREIASTAESLSSLYTPKLTRVRRQNQNCVGSQCQQNNFQVRSPFGGGFNGFFPFGQFGGAGRGSLFGGGNRFGATQNCVGSQCAQNNRGFTGIGGGGGATQNCVGSQCQQNNGFFGRRKREVRSIQDLSNRK